MSMRKEDGGIDFALAFLFLFLGFIFGALFLSYQNTQFMKQEMYADCAKLGLYELYQDEGKAVYCTPVKYEKEHTEYNTYKVFKKDGELFTILRQDVGEKK